MIGKKYKILILTFSLLIFFLIATFSIFYFQWNKQKTDIFYNIKSLNNKIKNKNINFFQPFSIRIYDKNNELITQIYNKRQSYVEFDKFPPFIIDLLLLKEDREFFKHSGVNFKRILKAILIDLWYLKPVYGGSTITQQVSKLLFLTLDKTIKRKIFEIFTSFYIEKILTKEEILEIYLNIINLGFGRYGFNSASLFYFGKNVWELSFDEGIMLVSIISAPEKYSPLRNLKKAKTKYKTMLNLLVKFNRINQNEADKIYENFWKKYNFSNIYNNEYIYNVNKSNWISSLVLNFIKNKYNLKDAFIGNYKVYTTFDLKAQKYSIMEINNYFKTLYSKLDDKYKNEINKLEIGFVAIDPHSGQILTMIGGRRFSPLNEYNRALYSRRQIGSTIKPFLYSYALKEKVITPLSIIEDGPITLNIDGKEWSPKNYGEKYFGKVPVYKALQKSLNSVSVRISQMINLEDFIIYFANFFPDKKETIEKRLKPYPSLALGSFEFSPIELAQAYSVFVNNGNSIVPYYIKKIVSGNNIIFEHANYTDNYENLNNNEKSLSMNKNNLNNNSNNNDNNNSFNNNISKNNSIYRQIKVISKSLSKIVSYLLSFPLKKGGTAYYAKIKNNYQFPIYGKTGTTNGYRDSWFVGFSNNIVTVCWIGYEKGKGNLRLTGGGFSADLDLKILKYLYPLYPGDINFDDKNIKFVNICTVSYKLANKNCPDVSLLLDIHDIPYEHCNIHKDTTPDFENIIKNQNKNLNIP